MKIPNPYFENIPTIGNLIMDFIIYGDDYPVLFICRTAGDKLYLCDCCSVYQIQKWLIAPMSIDRVESLLRNRITIRDCFEKASGNCCVATWQLGDMYEKYEIITADRFDERDLPEKNAYIDAGQGEYEDYISLLKNRKFYRTQINIQEKIESAKEDQGGRSDSCSFRFRMGGFETIRTVDYLPCDITSDSELTPSKEIKKFEYEKCKLMQV